VISEPATTPAGVSRLFVRNSPGLASADSDQVPGRGRTPASTPLSQTLLLSSRKMSTTSLEGPQKTILVPKRCPIQTPTYIYTTHCGITLYTCSRQRLGSSMNLVSGPLTQPVNFRTLCDPGINDLK
jgi:hypothetical protein